MICLDFETYYDKDYSLKKCTMEEYIRSPKFQTIGVSVTRDGENIRWITGDHEYILKELQALKLEEQMVVAHNAAFDCAILNWIYGIRPKVIIDTMSMLRPLIGIYPQGVSLRAAAEFFGIGHKGDEVYNTLGKRREDFTPEELARFGEYCRNDVALTWKLWDKMRPIFPVREVFLIDLTIRMFTEPVLQVDVPKLEKEYEKIVQKKEKLLASVAGYDRGVFMSNDRFAELLRAHGVEPPMKLSGTTGEMTYAFAKTDKGMQALLEHPDELVRVAAMARLGLKSTIEETRTKAFIEVGKRGPIPIHLQYYGAVNTGRFSGGSRLNPQNLPRGGALRESLVAPEGYSIVACDSSNVEARTVAWLAGEKSLLDLFAAGEDVYSAFASKIYNRPINKHDNPTERHVGKTCFAAGTLVLTNTGWRSIEQLDPGVDTLWDGESWVTFHGLTKQETKSTLTFAGVTATPDHLCWTGNQWLPWETLTTDGNLFQKALNSVSLPLLTVCDTPCCVAKQQDSEQITTVYDVANAGPNHRYVVLTDKGPMLVHNCVLGLGYGTGAAKLQEALHNGLVRVDLSFEECKRIVDLYRTTYSNIKAFWKQCNIVLENMYAGYSGELGVGMRLPYYGKDNSIILPSDLKIVYPELRMEQGAYGFEFSYFKKKFRTKIYGAAVVENITQAVARILVSYQMCKIKQFLDAMNKRRNDGKVRRVVHMVHDEVVVVVPDKDVAIVKEAMEDIMSTAPNWAPGLPLACEAGVGKNYGEAK